MNLIKLEQEEPIQDGNEPWFIMCPGPKIFEAWVVVPPITFSLSQTDISLRQYNELYCYDGDTCYVTINGENEKIRLLELDTPEISKPKKLSFLDGVCTMMI